MIFSNGRDLLKGNIHGNNFQILAESQNRGLAMGVDFHYRQHRVFWTDIVQKKVNSNFWCITWDLIELQAQSVDSFSFWEE